MSDELNKADFETILEALKHYEMHIENYSDYPSYEFKQQQMERVESAMRKMSALHSFKSS
jgi:hypothetical protein